MNTPDTHIVKPKSLNETIELIQDLINKTNRCKYKCSKRLKQHKTIHGRISLITGTLFLLASMILLAQMILDIEFLETYDNYIEFCFMILGLLIKFISKAKKYPSRISTLLLAQNNYQKIEASLTRSIYNQNFNSLKYIEKVQSRLIKIDDQILQSEGSVF